MRDGASFNVKTRGHKCARWSTPQCAATLPIKILNLEHSLQVVWHAETKKSPGIGLENAEPDIIMIKLIVVLLLLATSNSQEQ